MALIDKVPSNQKLCLPFSLFLTCVHVLVCIWEYTCAMPVWKKWIEIQSNPDYSKRTSHFHITTVKTEGCGETVEIIYSKICITYYSTFWQNTGGNFTITCFWIMFSFPDSNFKRGIHRETSVNINSLNPASLCCKYVQMPESLKNYSQLRQDTKWITGHQTPFSQAKQIMILIFLIRSLQSNQSKPTPIKLIMITGKWEK